MKGTDKKKLISRPPVIVVMGHVDHGKTSLLDYIRKSHVAEKESGGITQHIGAYEISHNGKKITFIDTPGHEAFSAMRSRGARVADVAILVVAADEGVKNQTKEAISHIKTAGIPMIAVLNKVDKSEADSEKTKRGLANQDVLVESLGGKIPSVEVSAKTGQGVGELLELILLLAEMEDLKIDISKNARGVIIESHLDSFRGPSATAIIEEGILKKGAVIGTESAIGKVKILEDFQGNSIEKALPSMPVVILGFGKVPFVGENFKVFVNPEEAEKNLKLQKLAPKIFSLEPDKKVLNIILKTDVFGSLEAIEGVLKALPQEKVLLRIIKSEVGNINDSDIKLAKSAKALIIGFRVKIGLLAKSLATREKIKIKNFEVIYELSQTIKELLEKMIEPEKVRTKLGKIKVLVIFRTEKNRQIIGGKVVEGKVIKGARLETLRNEEKIGEGKIISVQRNKKEIEEVLKGSECGLLYEGDVKVEVGDILEAYLEEKKKVEP